MAGPVREQYASGGEMEAGLPHCLRMIGAELDCGMAFEDALAGASDEDSAFGAALWRVLAESRSGGAPDALARLSARTDSLAVKRAACALAQSYARGGGGEQLKALAGELARAQRISLKAYASRLSSISLVFTVASCIVPALFLSLTVAGSPLLGEIVSRETVWLFFLGGLPLALACLAYAAWRAAPSFLRAANEGTFSEARRKRIGFPPFWQVLAASGTAGLCAVPALGISPFALAAGGAVAGSPLLAYALLAWRAQRPVTEAEARLPDALLHAGAQLSCDSFEGALASIAASGYGGLGRIASRACARIRAGESVPDALRAVGTQSGSPLVQRSFRLLARAAETGADALGALRETAQDAAEIAASRAETQALLAPQRYTLLACVALVPAILGFLAGAVGSMPSLPAGGFAEFGNAEAGEGLLENSLAAVEMYLLVFSVLAAVFLAVQEGEAGKALVYAPAFAAIAFAVFHGASGLGFP